MLYKIFQGSLQTAVEWFCGIIKCCWVSVCLWHIGPSDLIALGQSLGLQSHTMDAKGLGLFQNPVWGWQHRKLGSVNKERLFLRICLEWWICPGLLSFVSPQTLLGWIRFVCVSVYPVLSDFNLPSPRLYFEKVRCWLWHCKSGSQTPKEWE